MKLTLNTNTTVALILVVLGYYLVLKKEKTITCYTFEGETPNERELTFNEKWHSN
jgi:hypothetical protein